MVSKGGSIVASLNFPLEREYQIQRTNDQLLLHRDYHYVPLISSFQISLSSFLAGLHQRSSLTKEQSVY